MRKTVGKINECATLTGRHCEYWCFAWAWMMWAIKQKRTTCFLVSVWNCSTHLLGVRRRLCVCVFAREFTCISNWIMSSWVEGFGCVRWSCNRFQLWALKFAYSGEKLGWNCTFHQNRWGWDIKEQSQTSWIQPKPSVSQNQRHTPWGDALYCCTGFGYLSQTAFWKIQL